LVGSTNLTITDTFGLDAGCILNAGNQTITVGSDSAVIGMIVGTGKMSGTLKRWTNGLTPSYDFPLLVNNNNRGINITYTIPPTTAGTISVNYATGAPGAGGLPTSDVSLGLTLATIADAGIWNLTNNDGLVDGTFDAIVTADSIAGVNVVNQTALVYRANSFGSWLANGTAITTTGTPAALVLNRAGLTSYGQYGIAGTSANPLPVTLTSFTVLAKAKDANLTWSTATEINNKGFDVERSVDGKSFVKVAFVKGAVNSNVKMNYALTDAKAFVVANSNILYYRLKQVDLNGTVTYSQVVKVSINAENVNTVLAYPNPFTTDYSVSFTTAKAGVANIVMVDMQGRKVLSFTTDIVTGNNMIPVNTVATLEAGVYFVSVAVNGETQVIKLVKN
jgi:hypothetical protein